MSNSALTKVFALGPDVKGSRRLVLLVLADYADDEGYSYPKISTIAKRAGIERDETVRECLAWLEGQGLIERIVNGWAGVRGQIPVGKRPNLYRMTMAPRTSGGEAPREPGGEGTPESGGEIPQPGPPTDPPPPTPPPAEGPSDQPELFAPGAGGGAVTVGERKARAGKAAKTMVEGAYRAWLDRWPKGNRGSIPAGLRAFSKAITAGAVMEDLDRQARNYQAARVAYHEAWRDVGDYWPTLMHCSTFLNGKRDMWDHEWGRDDLRYWPAPAGWSWDDRPVTSHDATGIEVPAEIRAQGGVAVAMWQAKQTKAGAVAGG